MLQKQVLMQHAAEAPENAARGIRTLFAKEIFPMRPTRDQLMTVGDLRRELDGLPDDATIFFGCDSLRFYRIKQRGENYYQIEFDQTVYDNDEGEVFIDNHLPLKPLQ